jgi:hypothetical protein
MELEPLVSKVWSQDRQHQLSLGDMKESKYLGPTQIYRIRSSENEDYKSGLNKPSSGFRYTQQFESH